MRRTGRRLLAAVSSYRLRVLGWFVLLLALGTTGTVLVVGEVLLQDTDERIRRDLVQESEEFRQLAGGNDPETGEPFLDNVTRIFDVYLERNVPARNEIILTFSNGALYKRSIPIPPYELGQDRAFVELVHNLAQPATGRVDLGSPIGTVDYLAVPVLVSGQTRGVFTVAAFRDLERAQHGNIVRAVTTVGLVLLVIGTVLAWRLADRVLAPVRRTTATARAITETDLSRRVEVRGYDEIADLAKTFNEMLDRISAGFEAQRRFMDDAGHELRTPLTIVSGHVELLDGSDPEELSRERELILDELDRMAGLVDDLVLLASATRPDFMRRSEVDAGDLIESVYQKARVLADRDWQTAIVRGGQFMGDRHRLTQALLQLVENAVRHTSDGALIEIGADTTNGTRLWVRDTGRGIPEAEQEAVFRRFYRAGDARSTGFSTGLGLSIVRAIAESHGGRAALESEPGVGSTFMLLIPNQPAAARTP